MAQLDFKLARNDIKSSMLATTPQEFPYFPEKFPIQRYFY